MSCILQFTDDARFMASSLLNLVIIFFMKGFMKLYVNAGAMIKNVKLAELDINIVTAFLNTKMFML